MRPTEVNHFMSQYLHPYYAFFTSSIILVTHPLHRHHNHTYCLLFSFSPLLSPSLSICLPKINKKKRKLMKEKSQSTTNTGMVQEEEEELRWRDQGNIWVHGEKLRLPLSLVSLLSLSSHLWQNFLFQTSSDASEP